MTNQEQQAVLTLVLMAAFADGTNDPTERAEVKRIADSFPRGGEINVPAIYQDVILERASLEGAARALGSPETRRLAYELAVGVCDADGAMGEAERRFLATLNGLLAFDPPAAAEARAFTDRAEALAVAPLATVTPVEPPALPSSMSAEEQDRLILNYAILNGALELLPDTLASMAIIPLQMKMVYRIGRAYGVELDRGHIKDFLATAGIGVASQYVEQVAVKLVGRLFGRGLAGGLLGGAARQAVSSGLSFAVTYALGKLAVRYYAGGRTFSTRLLKEAYAGLLGEARGLQGQYLPAIREKARTVDVSQVLTDLRL